MTSLEYLRPTTMEEAVKLLEHGIPLAGGTELTPMRSKLGVVIDLSNLGLDQITLSDHTITIGAMTTLQSILVETNLPEALLVACQLEAGWNLRNVATLGGTIIVSEGRSPLITILLALDATVHSEPNSERIPLDDFLNIRNRPQIICKVEFDRPQELLYDQVARSPMDFPLVCAALAKYNEAQGENGVHIAVGGHGDRPIRLREIERNNEGDVDIEKAALNAKRVFTQASDPWASGEYRSAVAGILVKRLLIESHEP